jgi:hypothetical protein
MNEDVAVERYFTDSRLQCSANQVIVEDAFGNGIWRTLVMVAWKSLRWDGIFHLVDRANVHWHSSLR